MFHPVSHDMAHGAASTAAASPKRAEAMARCHVIIVGAGIGGLTAALSLQRHGFRIAVYEQASELGEVGAGLLVTPNAMHALDFLGVGDAIAATSNVSTELHIRHYRTGEVLRRRPPGDDYKSKYGAGHFQVHRADLHRALSAAVLANDPTCIHLGRAFTDLVQHPGGVVAHFADGTVAKGDVLIGCDGGRSMVRDKVHGSEVVRYTGQACFRALIPTALLPDKLRTLPRCMHLGPGRVLIHFALRKSAVMNVVAFARQPRWEDEGWTIPAEVSELRELYSDFHPDVLQMIESIEPKALFKWGLRDREPLQRWTLGRVSMLGDAAHPMSPFLGQGAVVAIEDGTVLGRCFAKAHTPEEALLLYEAARKQRANAAQIHSRERVNAMQGSNLERPNPGRDAQDLGMFEYNPATVPI
jgi:2-polyprenyl-6-methoxyphenol hydroxylase-like FAD-dependent oxidoreductase